VGSITQTDFGYTGQRQEGYTGLMDYRARFYDGSLGRFLQPDSIVPGVANPQNFNRFSYVGNSPIDQNDPTGYCARANYKTQIITDDECEAGQKEGWKTYSPKIKAVHQGRNCKGLECVIPSRTKGNEITLPTGLSENFPSPWACELIDCVLSTVGVLATGVSMFTVEAAPPVAAVAVVIDIGVTVWSIGRTENDYSKGKISNTRRWILNGTGLLGLPPTGFGFTLSTINMAVTFLGLPK
jgi:RHS repeat-associated protein